MTTAACQARFTDFTISKNGAESLHAKHRMDAEACRAWTWAQVCTWKEQARAAALLPHHGDRKLDVMRHVFDTAIKEDEGFADVI